MRILFLTLALLSAAMASANERYETLLRDLAGADDKAQANALTNEIWQIWLTAPDEAAQAVLDSALQRRSSRDFLGAIGHLDRLVDSYPDYAEGWNQRATMYYMIGDFEASLRDVAETLEREPRHFGALSGKAIILYQQGKIALAQIAMREALKYHPWLNERRILDIEAGEDL